MPEVTQITANLVRRRRPKPKATPTAATTNPADGIITVFDDDGIASWRAPNPVALTAAPPPRKKPVATTTAPSYRQSGGGAQHSAGFGRGGGHYRSRK